jgi:hypothetical protein
MRYRSRRCQRAELREEIMRRLRVLAQGGDRPYSAADAEARHSELGNPVDLPGNNGETHLFETVSISATQRGHDFAE